MAQCRETRLFYTKNLNNLILDNVHRGMVGMAL